MDRRPDSLPLSKQIAYSFGQFGWSLASYGVTNLISYFYFAPVEKGVPLFPTFVTQAPLLGFLPLLGVLSAGGRVFDAFTDPAVAYLSDRSRSRFGRRRFFMLIGGLPFALFSVLVFIPLESSPGPGNAIWLSATLFLFYLAMTIYVVPFTALLSELGHTSEERLRLATMVSLAWAFGFALGNQAFALQHLLEAVLSPTRSFQTAMGLFALLSLAAMYIPVFAIDERLYARKTTTNESVRQSIATTWRNRNFVAFSVADLMYWMALTIIQAGIGYYVPILLGLPGRMASVVMTAFFGASLLFYVPAQRLASVYGKKALMRASFLLFGLMFALFFAGRLLGLDPWLRVALLVLPGAFPIAVFGIVPTAMLADIAEAHGRRTGVYKAGMFFGTRNLVRKLGVSFANLLFPSFLLLGRSPEEPTGIVLSVLTAAGLCVVGFLAFLFYREGDIVEALAEV
jgi:glycoside/pentoside/hexuronide:cation symporter, GPH family